MAWMWLGQQISQLIAGVVLAQHGVGPLTRSSDSYAA